MVVVVVAAGGEGGGGRGGAGGKDVMSFLINCWSGQLNFWVT